MAHAIIWYVTVLGSAALFYGIGVFAQKREKPMWFWAGDEVQASDITDIKQYNKENGMMWKQFSVWFWIAGVAEMFSPVIALIFLILGCTVGIALLVRTFLKIDKKYRRTAAL